MYSESQSPLQGFELELFFWWILIIGLMIFALYKICRGRYGFNQERRQARQRNASHPSRQVTHSEPENKTVELDTVSSPIGDVCINCGAVFKEEIETHCPSCGIRRERCPICQRFIAGRQDLLGCPFCNTFGHANEMEAWVRKKVKCPHCGHRLGPTLLVKPVATH